MTHSKKARRAKELREVNALMAGLMGVGMAAMLRPYGPWTRTPPARFVLDEPERPKRPDVPVTRQQPRKLSRRKRA